MNSHGTAAVPASPRPGRVVRWALAGGILALVLAVGLGALIELGGNGPLQADTRWLDALLPHRAPVWTALALAFNFLGGSLVAVYLVPTVTAVTLALRRRPWAAGFYLLVTVASALLVQLLKHLYGRPRPEQMLVHSDFGSFPSGHVANAATLAVALAILFPRLWLWAAGALYTAAMMLSRTYLGAHWLSDTVGGLLLGLGVAAVIWAPLAAALDRERGHSPGHPLRVAAPGGDARRRGRGASA